jgi:hypothetical protein
MARRAGRLWLALSAVIVFASILTAIFTFLPDDVRSPQPVERERRLSAAQLAKEFEANPEAASKRYYQLKLRVTGTVESVADRSVLLETQFPGQKVYASFSATDSLPSFDRGQNVTVLCKGEGYRFGRIILTGCSLAR